MEYENNEWIIIFLNLTFISLFLKLSHLFQHLIQIQYNLPYSSGFSSLSFLIIISCILGNITTVLIKHPRIKNKEFNWLKIKRNQRIFFCIAFLLNILVWFVFVFKANTEFFLPYSGVLFASIIFFMLTYAMGIASVYFMDFICKKVNKKAEKYAEDKEKEETFRGIVTGIIVLCSAVIAFVL